MNSNSENDDLLAGVRLEDPAFHLGDPLPTYAELRRESPVHWCESGGFWALLKYRDITWAESQSNPPLTVTDGLFIPEALRPSRVSDRDPGNRHQSGPTFSSDPPDLTQLRRAVSGAFMPKQLEGLDSKVRSVVSELLDALPDDETVNFVEAVSVLLSIRVMAEFLGVPRQDWDLVRQWTDSHMALLGGAFADGTPEKDRAVKSEEEMFEYISQSLNARRRDPADDLMSTVAQIKQDGKFLPELAQINICIAFLIAGNDTTRNTLSGGIAAFARAPDQWIALLAQPSLSRNAADEVLRWVTPVLHFGRRATESFVLRGAKIGRGDFLVMLYESGNHDEDIWENPSVFDVARPQAQRHLSFGWGLHRCIGAALARVEVAVVLEELAKRYKSWELTGPVVRNPSVIIKDYRQVPILFSRHLDH